MNYLAKYILIPVLITAATTFGIQNYIPLDWIDFLQPQKFGTTMTNIAGTDTISGSRTTINTNFTNLYNEKFALSDWYATTSAKQLTTLAGLTSIGTITTGVWNGTTLTVSKGGTGSTTLSAYQVLLGNGTSGITVPSGWGTSGQFLTSNGAGAYPSWQTSSVALGDNYVWTGLHSFAATTTMATTTATRLGVGTSSPTTDFSVKGDTYITSGLGVGVATTSDGNLRVSNYLQVDGMASTTNLTVSGSCTNCVPMYSGTDSTPYDYVSDTNIITVGFQPRYISYIITAADSNETGWAWGTWIDPDGDGTGSYSTFQTENAFGTPLIHTIKAFNDSFTDSAIDITFIDFTSTGFSIRYVKVDAEGFNNSASIQFTAMK